MTADEKRAYLKSKGWHRKDRTWGSTKDPKGQQHEEYWSHPTHKKGNHQACVLMSFKGAYALQQRLDGEQS